jgi:trypsin
MNLGGSSKRLCFVLCCLIFQQVLSALLSNPDIPYNGVEGQVKGISGNDEGERIVGGEDSQPGKHTHQVALYSKDGSFICGGSIIIVDIILTAAHCTEEVDLVKVGLYDRTDDSTAEIIDICDKVNHPEYGTRGKNDDIGLLRLCKPSELATKGIVKTINLNHDSNVPEDNQVLTVTGWGATSEYGYLSKKLQQVHVNYIPEAQCANIYKLSDSMMCAGVMEGGKDACLGDSGGPIILEGTGGVDNDTLVGVVSWGIGCAEPGFPGVYTRVSYEIDWILVQACYLSKSKPCSIPNSNSSSSGVVVPMITPANPTLKPTTLKPKS